jgi:hypothetical protein
MNMFMTDAEAIIQEQHESLHELKVSVVKTHSNTVTHAQYWRIILKKKKKRSIFSFRLIEQTVVTVPCNMRFKKNY